MSIKIKLSGLRCEQDVDYVNEVRPDWAGVMLSRRFRRCVDFDQARQLRRRLRDDIPLVGIFVNDKFSDVLVALRQGIVDMVQLQGTESEEYITSLQMMSYGKPIIKACELHTPDVLHYAEDSAADHVLLYCPATQPPEARWDAVKDMKRPFLLAGGLTPENLSDVVESVHPWGVDLCSGVEHCAGTEHWVKDRRRMLDAVALARSLN